MKWITVVMMGLTLLAGAQEPVELSPEPEVVEEVEIQFESRSEDAGPRRTDAFIRAEDVVKTMEAIEAFLGAAPAADAAAEGAGDAMTMGVRDCVRMALERNAKVLVAESDVDAARAKIGQARSQMLPQAGAQMALVHTEFTSRNPGGIFGKLSSGSSMGGGLGIGGVGGGVGGGDLRTSLLFGAVSLVAQRYISENFTPRLTPDDTFRRDQFSVRQVLYAGGQIRAAIEAAKALTESQEWQRAVVLANVEYDAKQAYYDTFLVTALLEVANESVRTFERNLSDAQQMFDVGMISSFEVLRARTELGARRADAVAAENALRLAYANLRSVLFLPENTPIQLSMDLDWAPEPRSLDELVGLAYEHRPEILALRKALEAARHDQRRVRGQYLPRVAASAEYANTHKGGLSTPDGWTLSLGGEIDIYTGGRRKHERIEAQARVASIERQLDSLERLVELDVTSSRIRIQDAMAKIQSERGTVDLAQEGLRLAELRFQEGVGTQSDILDAELALTNAETSLFVALREYAVANAALEKATGTSWGVESAMEPPAQ